MMRMMRMNKRSNLWDMCSGFHDYSRDEGYLGVWE
jgi:hypothetical protein